MSETTPASDPNEPELVGDILRRALAGSGLPELDPTTESQRHDEVDRRRVALGLSSLLQSYREQFELRQSGIPTDPAIDGQVEADLGEALKEAERLGLDIYPEIPPGED